jgi:S-adenosylmethionine/arginine decarboxylase-like enzyme
MKKDYYDPFLVEKKPKWWIGEAGMEKMTSRVAPKEDAIPWGLLTSLDIYGCNPQIIREAEQIRQYVIELCDLIGMQRFGECQVVYFGKDEHVEGHSMVQLIETSLISGHFANLTKSAYIDIFSCKAYDPEQVAGFSKEFFRADSVEVHVTKRM